MAYLQLVLCLDNTFGIFIKQYLWHLMNITVRNIIQA